MIKINLFKVINKGFSLIEMMVVLGVSSLLVITVGSVMASMFKAKNQSDSE